MTRGAIVAVESVMDTPPGRDELGTPDDQIEECRCGVLFRTGERHRCELAGGWLDWIEYQAREAVVGGGSWE